MYLWVKPTSTLATSPEVVPFWGSLMICRLVNSILLGFMLTFSFRPFGQMPDSWGFVSKPSVGSGQYLDPQVVWTAGESTCKLDSSPFRASNVPKTI